MKYRIKPEVARNIKITFKGGFFLTELGISKSYLSQVLNGKKMIPRMSAYAFTKLINSDARIIDFFDEV